MAESPKGDVVYRMSNFDKINQRKRIDELAILEEYRYSRD